MKGIGECWCEKTLSWNIYHHHRHHQLSSSSSELTLSSAQPSPISTYRYNAKSGLISVNVIFYFLRERFVAFLSYFRWYDLFVWLILMIKLPVRFLQDPEALKQKPWFMIRNILQSPPAPLAVNARTSPAFPRKKTSWRTRFAFGYFDTEFEIVHSLRLFVSASKRNEY